MFRVYNMSWHNVEDGTTKAEVKGPIERVCSFGTRLRIKALTRTTERAELSLPYFAHSPD